MSRVFDNSRGSIQNLRSFGGFSFLCRYKRGLYWYLFLQNSVEDSYLTSVADCILVTERKEKSRQSTQNRTSHPGAETSQKYREFLCATALPKHYGSTLPWPPQPPRPKVQPKNWFQIYAKRAGLSPSVTLSFSRLMTTPGTVALCSTKENGHYRQMVCVCVCVCVRACVCTQVHRQAKRQGHGK